MLTKINWKIIRKWICSNIVNNQYANTHLLFHFHSKFHNNTFYYYRLKMVYNVVKYRVRRMKWSGWEDLNFRPFGPEPNALTELRYIPTRTFFFSARCCQLFQNILKLFNTSNYYLDVILAQKLLLNYNKIDRRNRWNLKYF